MAARKKQNKDNKENNEKKYSELEFFKEYCKNYPQEDVLHFINFLDTNKETYAKEVKIYASPDISSWNAPYNPYDSNSIAMLNHWNNYVNSDDEMEIEYCEKNKKKRNVVKSYEKVYYANELEDFIKLKYKHGNLVTFNLKDIEHPNFNLLDAAVLLSKTFKYAPLDEKEIITELISDNKSFFIEHKKNLINNEELKKVCEFEKRGLGLKALKNIYLATEIDIADTELTWFNYAKEINKEKVFNKDFQEWWCVNFLESYTKANGYKKQESILKDLVNITQSVDCLDEVSQYIPLRLLKRDQYLVEVSDNLLILHPRIYDNKLTSKEYIKETLEVFTYKYNYCTYELVKKDKPKHYTLQLHEDINAIEVVMNEKNNSVFINTPNKQTTDDMIKGLEKLLPLMTANKKMKIDKELKNELYQGIEIIVQYLIMNNQVDKNMKEEVKGRKGMKI